MELGGTVADVPADTGRLDLDAPIASYWPGFGHAGKAAAGMLSHRAGLPYPTRRRSWPGRPARRAAPLRRHRPRAFAGLGYPLSSPSIPGLGRASYGHTGAGARLGLADPDHDVAIGLVCNSMRTIGAGDDGRRATLLAAPRSCI